MVNTGFAPLALNNVDHKKRLQEAQHRGKQISRSPWSKVTGHLLELKMFNFEWKLISYLQEENRKETIWRKMGIEVLRTWSLSELSETQPAPVVTANICISGCQKAPKVLFESNQARTSSQWCFYKKGKRKKKWQSGSQLWIFTKYNNPIFITTAKANAAHETSEHHIFQCQSQGSVVASLLSTND